MSADIFWRSSDGLRLHARDYPAAGPGDRLPVFCLHGLTRNARDFDAIAPEIAAWGRRVLAIDVRGRGLSERDPEARYLVPTYAEDAVALAASLGIARAVILGTSMGGLIAMELARIAPGLIGAAIVNDVGPELDPRGLARILAYVGKGPASDDWDSAAAYLRDQNARALPHYGDADWARMARRTFHEADGRVVPDYDPAIARPFAGAPAAADPWAGWAALTDDRPVLLLRGTLSDLLSAEIASRMIAGRATVTLRDVAGVGHAPMLDEPDAIAAIRAFLDQVD